MANILDLSEQLKRMFKGAPRASSLLGPLGMAVDPVARKQFTQTSVKTRDVGRRVVDYGARIQTTKRGKPSFIGQQVGRPLQFAGGTIEGLGRGAELASQPAKTLQTFRKAPTFNLQSFGDYKNPSKASMILDVGAPGMDIGDVGRMGIIGGMATGRVTGKGIIKELPQISAKTPPLSPIKVGVPSQAQKTAPLSEIQLIKEAKAKIGAIEGTSTKGVKEEIVKAANTFYTQWVDRFHPLVAASGKAKKALKIKGARLLPEHDPEFLVRRLTGAGGIADARFKGKLEPIISRLDDLSISRSDINVYLANKRIAGFGKAGREIIGADPEKSQRVVEALNQKYGGDIIEISEEFYKYQDEGLEEMIKAGFISADDAKVMRQQNPDYSPLYRIMDDINDYLGLPTRKTMQATQPIKRIKGSERQIQPPLESIIADTYSQRAAIEKNRVAKSVVGLQNVIDMGFERVGKEGYNTITVKGADGLAEYRKILKPEYQQADDVIFIWEGGRKEAWKVGKDIADVAKGTNEESMNLVLKLLQVPAQILRQGATGRNPAFMIPNIVRDQLDAAITSKYGYVPFIDYARGLRSMLKNDEIYQKWLSSGAKIDLGEMSGRKSITKYVSGNVEKRRVWDWISVGLDKLGKYSEQPTRVGLFKKAYEKTNQLLAVKESRDATVDFARMGSKMKVANSIIPFLNVSVQGFDKLMRAAKNRPGKVLALMATYAVMPQVVTSLYNLANYPEEYSQIPDYVKESNFIIVTGRNDDGTASYIKLPKGNILPIAANPVQNLLEYAYGQDTETFGQLATNVISGALPVLGEGSTGKEVLTKTIGQNLPQAIKPLAEAAVNKSFYKYDPKRQEARDIVPYYLKDKPAYKQDYEFTPQMYKKLGAIFNASPLVVKNTMEGYLAGYTKIPAQAIEIMYKLANDEKISPNEIPVAYRFYQYTYKTSGKEIPEKEVPGLFERLGLVKDTKAAEDELPVDTEELSILYKDAQRIISGYKEKKVKKRYAGEDISDIQEELDDAIATKKLIEKDRPSKVLDIQISTFASGGGAGVEERAEWAATKLNAAKNAQEYTVLYDKLLEGEVITKSVAKALREAGLKANSYTSGGEIKSLGGGKKKKVSVTRKPVKITTSKTTFRPYVPRKFTLARAPKFRAKEYKQASIKMNFGSVPVIKKPSMPQVRIVKY